MRTALCIAIASCLALSASARLGPPTICFPLVIGDAKTLPDGGDKGGLGKERLDAATARVLGGSDDALVHMETLRRAFFLGEGGSALGDVREMLEDRVIEAELDAKGSARKKALAWFDLGYYRRILEEGTNSRDEKSAPCIEKALALAPDDGAIRLGAAYVYFDHREGRPQYFVQVAAAARSTAAKDPDGLLRQNLEGALQRFSSDLLADGFDGIAARADAACAAVEKRTAKSPR